MAFLDSIYSAVTKLLPAPVKFFHSGYGNMDVAMEVRQEVIATMASSRRASLSRKPIAISWADDKEEKTLRPRHSRSGSWWPWRNHQLRSSPGDGHEEPCIMVSQTATFESPAVEWLPPASRQACFRCVYPKTFVDGGPRRVAIHMPTTGDQFYWLRTRVAEELVHHDVVSIIPMFPFYGPRRPESQTAHFLGTVSDFATASSAALLEATAISGWVRETYPGAMLCFTGVSMGGSLASAAAVMASSMTTARTTVPPLRVGVVPCVATSSAETFVRGVLRQRIAWDALGGESGVATVSQPHACGILRKDSAGEKVDTSTKKPDGSNNLEFVIDQLAAVLGQFSLASLLKARDSEGRSNSVKPQLQAVVQISARDDAFIPSADAEALHAILSSVVRPPSVSGTEKETDKMIWVEGGHLSLSCDAFSLGCYGGTYLQAIKDAFLAMEEGAPLGAGSRV